MTRAAGSPLGSVLATEPAACGPLTVGRDAVALRAAARHVRRVRLTGPAAEALRGILLVVDSAEVRPRRRSG